MGWGGRRPGSGRKPRGLERIKKTDVAKVVAHPSTPPPAAAEPLIVPGEGVAMPGGMSEAEQAVWARQAPHAIRMGTLTPGTVLAFARYCRVVVTEELEAKGEHPGGTNHRGMLALVSAYERQFLLAP